MPRFSDIFTISGNALMNHLFSIVISFEKGKNGSVRFCGSDAPFHWRFNFFLNFWPNFVPGLWDIFSISGNALMNHFFSIVISFEKAKNGSLRFCGSDAPLHWTFNFFTTFDLTLGPDFEIFSRFQEMRLWIPSLAL